ncbi:MAG: sel1 repeat family protein [Xanthobacteraceae bacterium]|nr:MAG: sel1 repeat family protein [Xanthobacteraceae bacterium]
MRMSSRPVASLLMPCVIAVMAMLALPARGFDGNPPPAGATPVAAALPPGAAAVKNAVPSGNSLAALQYAADGGHPIAQWKLGRMYADGDGVTRDNLRAFDYFSKICNAHAEDNPAAPQAPVIANAFVALGQYYLDGIPDTHVKADAERAREMFAYAASYFGDANAQFHLGRLYLEGRGTSKDPKYAARWLGLAAHKGQPQAQALLGQMLFYGQNLPRQAARGLMWLTLARDSATPGDAWIKEAYAAAVSKASDDDRAMALRLLERWVQGRRN